jgi:hypothetical protein
VEAVALLVTQAELVEDLVVEADPLLAMEGVVPLDKVMLVGVHIGRYMLPMVMVVAAVEQPLRGLMRIWVVADAVVLGESIAPYLAAT